MPDILLDIVRSKMERVAQSMQRASLAQLRDQIGVGPKTRSFTRALRAHQADTANVIAEVKKASPSKGIIRADFDPVAIATEYVANGAVAISVLTEQDYFLGSLEYLRSIRAALPQIPILRKDFIFDPYQVYETAAAGADAVLLIVAMLSDTSLKELLLLAQSLGLAALVEVHTADELARAAAADAALIGVNNRDLKTFITTLETSVELAKLAPAGSLLISESGIEDQADIQRLQLAGYQAFLVGESLLREERPGDALRQLLGKPPRFEI